MRSYGSPASSGNGDRKFSGHYTAWQKSRIDKIVSIFSREYFVGRTVLELGCGYGDIGAAFRDMGAFVTLADGRPEYVTKIRARHKGIEVIRLDQDGYWDLDRKFDVILHMGVLYHLRNWQSDLQSTLNHSGLVILETEVANRSSPDFSIRLVEDGYDQALHRVASRVSAANIERELGFLGVSFTRYDDSDLNAIAGSRSHTYDWVVDDSGPEWRPALYRRFWTVRRPCG